MYRDDPLDDEMELRDILGDAAVDTIATGDQGIAGALDCLRLLQGWMTEDAVREWFSRELARLDGQTPVEALAADEVDDVLIAARAAAAASG